jgi:hypothetical protein
MLIIFVVLTIIIELPIVRLLLGNKDKIIFNIIAVNIVTNLLLNATLILLDVYKYVLLGEVFVIIAEAFLYKYAYREESLLKLMGISTLANIVSYEIGTLIF